MSDIINPASQNTIWSNGLIVSNTYGCNSLKCDGTITRHIVISQSCLSEFSLDNVKTGYGLIYNTLVEKNPGKAEEWKLLLQLNNNDYKNTVFQIEDYLSKIEK